MSSYKYLFGPVPSRRLGVSLGIDLITYKTCTLDCVYCESGSTTELTLERREYVSTEKVLAEIDDFLADAPKLDFITFSGSGEPTLASNIGKVIRYLKGSYPKYKIAVLTNGTLLAQEDVRKDLIEADLVIPSLDTAVEATFEKLNRAHKYLDLDKVIEGIIIFSTEYKGKLWLEIFLVKGINDKKEELNALKEVLLKINPQKAQLNTLDRPGSKPWVTPLNEAEMQEIIKYLSPLKAEIVANFKKGKKAIKKPDDILDLILSTLHRRPCTLNDLVNIYELHKTEVNKYLNILLAEKKIEAVKKERGVFFVISELGSL